MNNENQIPPIRLIIIFAVLSLITVGLTIALYKAINTSTAQSTNAEQTTYTDPGSGETIVYTKGKTPETYGINPDTPTYLGFASLLDVGFSDDQVRNTKAAFLDFASQNNKDDKIKEISITVDSIKQTLDPKVGSTYSFDITTNRKTKYYAKIRITDITSIDMSLFAEDQKTLVFTSIRGR
jgi:hypothetical protein